MRIGVHKLTDEQIQVVREELADTDHVALKRSDLAGALITSSIIGAAVGATVTAAIYEIRGQRKLMIQNE